MMNTASRFDMEKINSITGKILNAAIEVHREIGPWVFRDCL